MHHAIEAYEVVDTDLEIIQYSTAACAVAYLGLLWVLRKDSVSFGLPFAYLTLLFLQHVPGAYVQLADDLFMGHRHEVAIGIEMTAIGSLCFVIGVWLARAKRAGAQTDEVRRTALTWFVEDGRFIWFCILGGWLFTFGLTPLRKLPSINAFIYNGGAIWMLGILLGLRAACRRKDTKWIFAWTTLLAVYPIAILITAGFLSYGAAAVTIVICAIAVSARSYWRVIITGTLSVYLALSVFSAYFQSRDAIRKVAWSGASIDRRVGATSRIITEFKFFDGSDRLVLIGFDLRLNQNYFIGLTAENIERGGVKYLNGKSVSDALLALIPRAIWPEKSVYGGSPDIVSNLTGLWLNPDTSWGIGNVLEFYANFGVAGVIGGFIALGWLLGRLDHQAALAEVKRDYPRAIRYFLPGVALIQPLGSMVELSGSMAAAWVAALFWNWVWANWGQGRPKLQPRSSETT